MIKLSKEASTSRVYLSEKRIYADANGKIVEEGSDAAAFLVVGKGCEISEDDAKKFGLIPGGETTDPDKKETRVISTAKINKR